MCIWYHTIEKEAKERSFFCLRKSRFLQGRRAQGWPARAPAALSRPSLQNLTGGQTFTSPCFPWFIMRSIRRDGQTGTEIAFG